MWMLTSVAETVAQNHLDFVGDATPGCWGLVKDATTLGQPAKYYETLFLWHGQPEVGGWILPQDRSIMDSSTFHSFGMIVGDWRYPSAAKKTLGSTLMSIRTPF